MMAGAIGSLLVVILMCQIMYVNYAFGERLTIEIEGSREDCFYFSGNQSQALTVEYFVLGSTKGALHINFQLMDPNGRPLLTEFQKPSSLHKIILHFSGIYSVCFDNTFQSFSVKHITFTLSLDADNDKATWHKYDKLQLAPEADYGIHIKDISESIDRVRVTLNSIKHMQDVFQSMETIDRSTAESNFERVNFWSCVNISVMLTVGTLQSKLISQQYRRCRDISNACKELLEFMLKPNEFVSGQIGS